jgi:hypothetical protein
MRSSISAVLLAWCVLAFAANGCGSGGKGAAATPPRGIYRATISVIADTCTPRKYVGDGGRTAFDANERGGQFEFPDVVDGERAIIHKQDVPWMEAEGYTSSVRVEDTGPCQGRALVHGLTVRSLGDHSADVVAINEHLGRGSNPTECVPTDPCRTERLYHFELETRCPNECSFTRPAPPPLAAEPSCRCP